jgi:Zinc dependent phospholipase C
VDGLASIPSRQILHWRCSEAASGTFRRLPRDGRRSWVAGGSLLLPAQQVGRFWQCGRTISGPLTDQAALERRCLSSQADWRRIAVAYLVAPESRRRRDASGTQSESGRIRREAGAQMPGHFTHIYTARRVADLLAGGDFDDWPAQAVDGEAFSQYRPEFCGKVMQEWEKFAAIGAIGPDIFYFSQDYNTNPIGPQSDELMLALAAYYFFDTAKEQDWEPLLIILDQVNTTIAALLRFLIKLQKIWDDFVKAWNDTIGPLVDAASSLLDDLTGGLLSAFGDALAEFKTALITLGKEELFTFADIFGKFDTCVQKGWSENAFLWSDMSHYRRTSAFCRALVAEAEALRSGEDGETRFGQFLAFALGYATHLGTDTIAHSFVNEQCGGPFRDHPQRHHLIENHIDAWNYLKSDGRESAGRGSIPEDPWGATEDYPELSMSALWFAIQLTPDDPEGQQRPSPLPEDPAERQDALDVDGEMPSWMADAIVRAMIATFEGHPHPEIFGGTAFQQTIDSGMLANAVRAATGHGLDGPFQSLLDDIAPAPSFPVPPGFPMPWEIQTMYKIMYSFYRLSYNGTWELEKPRKPDFIIVPPASDFENLFQPPDFSGVDSSNPLVDVCEAFVALVEWAIKELGAAAQLVGDLIKMLASPGSYLIRLLLYELAMQAWDVVVKTHEVLAHTGFSIPHGEERYDDGELRLPNEIDLPLITLGGTVDGAFRDALDAAIDPLGNLDKDPGVIGVDHPVQDPRYPYYPVLRYHPHSSPEAWAYRRPWAYPTWSRFAPDGAPDFLQPTPTEGYDPSQPAGVVPKGPYPGLLPGPYPAGTRPDDVFFRTSAPVDREARAEYERSGSPARTDQLNAQNLIGRRIPVSPLGDPVPFSAYLIGRLVNDTGYQTQFNLDADRAYAYLTWDWIRGDIGTTSETGFPYTRPKAEPAGDPQWNKGSDLLQLEYVDAVQSEDAG